MEIAVNFEEIARSTEDFSGAMLKAVCVEAGMNALRREASCIEHEDYMEAISQVCGFYFCLIGFRLLQRRSLIFYIVSDGGLVIVTFSIYLVHFVLFFFHL